MFSLRLVPIALILLSLSLGLHASRLYWITATPAAAEDKPQLEAQISAQEAPPAADPDAPPPESDLPPEMDDDSVDVTDFTASEINLLQSLRERREEIRTQEAALDQRQRLIQGMEQRLDQKIDELNAIKDDIQLLRQEIIDLSDRFREKEDARITSLRKVYEKMKPADAARIFDNLDLTILLDVVRNMSERKLADILARMDSKKAMTVTKELGKRHDLPEVN